MTTLFQDLRYGIRMLLKSPGFTAVAIIALALGIGANTAIFSVVNALLLQSLPYKDADRLVMVWEHNRPRNRPQNVLSLGNFLDWREQASVFQELAAFRDLRVNLAGTGGNPEVIPAESATVNLFSTLGVQPALGRAFTPDDDASESQSVALLSHGLWQRRFGSDASIVGKTMMLDNTSVTIIGVLPADFKWFVSQGSTLDRPPELWLPMAARREGNLRGRYLMAVGRLKPDVTVTQAQTEMDTVARRLEQQKAESNTGWGVNLVPLREQFVGELRPALLVLLGAVGLVLLIACANVANLQLARAAARQKEIAIRTALGAGRLRIVRQLLTESVLLAGTGGVFGLLLAMWGVDALVALSPQGLLGTRGISLDSSVLGFTLVVSLLVGIIFGLAPALEASRFDPHESLKESGKSVAGGGRSRRARSAFVIAEVALALVLLVGAGLMIKSFLRLQANDPGFDASNLLTMQVRLPVAKYKEEEQVIAFFKQAVERIEALPGVRAAGAVSYLPFASLGAATGFTIEGKPAPLPGNELVTDVRVTDRDYLRAMNIPVLKGRTFNEVETTLARHVVVINEALARKYFPGEDPIGKRITIEMSAKPVPTEIIGVVGDAKYESLTAAAKPMVYWPHPELAYATMTLIVRTQDAPLNLAGAVQREIQSLDKDQPVSDIRTMEQWLAASTARQRFSTLLLGIFAVVALVLASVGIYGVMSYTVAQRTHEIGVRTALGAQASDVLKLIVKQGMILTLIGVALGLVAALAVTRVMGSLLFDVSATDPVTFICIALLLCAVAFIACYIPARRATKVDPMIALRYE